MTLAINDSRVTLTATGGQTVFPFTNIPIFTAISGEYLFVYRNFALIGPASYSITLTTPSVLPSDGTITLGTPALAGDIITIERRSPTDQLTVYTAGTAFPAKSHENALDKLTMHVQDIYRVFTQTPAFFSTKDVNLGWTYTDLPDQVTSQVPSFDPTSKTVKWIEAGGVGAPPTSFAGLTGTLDLTGVQVDAITVPLAGAVPRNISGRFGEFYSVKDFGAVADGVTDDSAAINACHAAGVMGIVYFPAGTYKCSANTTVTNCWIGQAATISIDATFTFTILGDLFSDDDQIFTGAGFYNITKTRPCLPEWWGADPTGTTDSLAAFDSCLQAMQDFNCWMQLKGGTYDLSTTMSTARQACRITGSAGSVGGTTIKNQSATANTMTFDCEHGPHLEHLSFFPTATRTAGFEVQVFSSIGEPSNTLIDHCAFQNNWTGIFLLDARKSVIRSCSFHTPVASCIKLDLNNASNTAFGDCTVEGCTFTNLLIADGTGVEINSGTGISVIGCHFQKMTVGVRILTSTSRVTNGIRIIGNNFQEDNFAIFQDVAGGWTRVDTCRGFTIAGNTFYQNNTSAYTMSGSESGQSVYEGVAITGNTFYQKPATDCINIQAQRGFAISGNHFEGDNGVATVAINVAAAAAEVLASGNVFNTYAADTDFVTAEATAIRNPVWLYHSEVWDPASVPANDSLALDVTVTGTDTGMMAFAQLSSLTTQHITISARTRNVDTVSVLIHNDTTGAIDLASGTLTVWVMDPGNFV